MISFGLTCVNIVIMLFKCVFKQSVGVETKHVKLFFTFGAILHGLVQNTFFETQHLTVVEE